VELAAMGGQPVYETTNSETRWMETHIGLGEQSWRIINLEYSTDGSLLFYLVYRNLKATDV